MISVYLEVYTTIINDENYTYNENKIKRQIKYWLAYDNKSFKNIGVKYMFRNDYSNLIESSDPAEEEDPPLEGTTTISYGAADA